jgi:hypothetical protein
MDPTVNAFLWSVRDILAGSRRKRQSPVHLTIRGPYDSDESKHDVIEYVRGKLCGDILQIAGVGTFSNPREHVVYFRVNSPNLRSVWWKPSYPIERYGFQPHVSVYRGPDGLLAKRAGAFLDQQQIVLNCAEYRVVWYESHQPNLFAASEPAVGDMDLMADSPRVNADVLDRLTELVDEHRFEGVRTGTTDT